MAITATKSTAQIRDKSDVIRDQIDARLQEIRSLEERLLRYESLPKDEYDNGAVVVFEKRFNKTGILYTYACVKGGGFWYTTGTETRYTWENLLDKIYDKISEGGSVRAYWVSNLEEL